jgi:sugar phosphate isomerase/epimerase
VNRDQIALQLYTVRERTAKDMVGTLRELAGVGYRAVEFAGYGGVPVAELRSTLDGLGMRAMAAHVGLGEWESRPEEAVADLKTLGCDFAVLPYLAPAQRGGAEATRTLADSLNRWGALCREHGLTYAYHNHDFEFASLAEDPSTTVMDVLLERTDPALVALELDIYWVAYAGLDPLAFLREHAARVPLLHVKDMAGTPDRADAPFGTGSIDWAPILAAAEPGVRWYIVEQDNPADALADVGTSLRNLEAMAAG